MALARSYAFTKKPASENFSRPSVNTASNSGRRHGWPSQRLSMQISTPTLAARAGSYAVSLSRR
ncbi:MAG: hypothetical protein C0505_18255 [Leptothrix sp. (in: Bacteria)]|nr:hypothetical protein [Leptothrix sp. (in: b-proteobacteria)]